MSTLPPGTDRFLAFFVPERWSPLDRLRELTGAPFPNRGLYIEGRMMVAAHLAARVWIALDHWRAAELTAPDDQRIFQQPALL